MRPLNSFMMPRAPQQLSQRQGLAGAFGFGLLVVLSSVCLLGRPTAAMAQDGPAARPVEWAQGRANAPVTVIEYGSLTCGHCATFNNDVKPALKRAFIDTGRVRFIFRPFPTPPHNLSVAMHVLTLCAGPDRYYDVIDGFFARQRPIFEAASGENGPRDILFAIAQEKGGLSPAQSEACLQNPTLIGQVRASFEAGNSSGVVSTPSLFINGRAFSPPPNQGYTLANVTAALNAQLATLAPRPKGPPRRSRR